jgi:hypothetical protein
MLWSIVSNIVVRVTLSLSVVLAVEVVKETNKCVKQKCLYDYSIILTTYGNISDEIKLLNSTECPINLNTFKEDTKIAMIPTCSHIFEEYALYEWVHHENTCPVCRQQIR